MQNSHFGDLVRALRENGADENGTRWTRDTLSRKIHLSADQLGRLERGMRKHCDLNQLRLLAETFSLTNLEKKELFYAGTGATDGLVFSGDEPLEQYSRVLSLLESLQMPAYILDVYLDILAIKNSTLELFQVTPELVKALGRTPAGYNMVRATYSAEMGFRETLGACWRETAKMALLFFRRSTLRFRNTDYFNYLFRILIREALFDVDWYSSHRFEDQFDQTFEHIRMRHPLHGTLSYTAMETEVCTSRGSLYLITYQPTDNATLSVFNRMAESGSNRVQRLAGWPKKVFL